MAMIPPPEGLGAADYDAIEAAVVETVRGRWFLAEYARRGRVDEMRQMLDGLARLEETVRSQPQVLPADPSIRLLVQRLKDVSQALGGLAAEMRAAGLDAHFCTSVEAQARAVAGVLRGSPAPNLPPPPEALPASRPALPQSAPPAPPRPNAEAALARLDALPTAEKVALFA